MSNDRDDIIEAFAEGRQAIDDLGLRRTYVVLRARRWYAGAAPPWTASARGAGFPVDTETPILPTPKVRPLTVRYVAESGGRFQSGDIGVTKIVPRNDALGVGVELADLNVATTAPNEERHVLLLGRGGTPWHVREGTARLYTPGPFDLGTALGCVNALATAYPGHLGDAEAHVVPDAAVVPAPAAGDLGTAITQANALRAVWVAHRASLGYHPAADPYPLRAPAAGPGDAQALLLLLHDLLRAFNAHVAPGDVSECIVVEAYADRAFEHTLVVRPTRRTP